ncbi:MAG: prephenate dehydrogenase/arogenate dehydrogenase family protein, partial [Candidatus Omnitrophota bacterium]|nr:prephenate dehydrogenase/arogenate dehydrogenase family protein [Candidatus Omnitrophota bacterium]
MKIFEKVAIIGVGLIGGSLGLAIRSAGLSRQVIGLTRHKKTLNLAKRYKAVTDATLELEKAVRDADLIIVAVPVFRIIKTVKNMMPYLKQGAIITDVGSVKGLVVKEIEKIPRIRKKEVYFIGGHPMAGSEKSGIFSARKDLFKGSFCFLAKTVFTDQRA